MHLIDLANALHNEFLRCFERKNGTTTQNQTEEMEETKE